MPGMAVNEQNCHPFAAGRYLWMHNGVIAGFSAIRRALVASLSDAAYDAVQSFHSDSSVAFGVFLHHLPDMEAPHPPVVLLAALRATLDAIAASQAAAGVTGTSLLNFCMSDGESLVATRYVASPDPAEEPASLYYAEGAAFRRAARAPPPSSAAATSPPASPRAGAAPRGPAPGATAADGEAEYELLYRDPGSSTVLIASEPITAAAGDWVPVPRNTAVVVTREKGAYVNVMLAPLDAGAGGAAAAAAEVAVCLDAVRGAADVARRAGGAPNRHPASRAPSVDDDRDGWRSDRGKAAGSDRGGGATPTPLPAPPDHRFTGHAGPVLCMAAARRTVFSGGVDATVRAWDVDTGECARVLRGHGGPVQRLATSALGDRLVSAGGRAVLVHDTTTWACVARVELPPGSGSLYALDVAPDGTLFVGGQDATLRAYSPRVRAIDGTAPTPTASLPPPATAPSATGVGHCSALCSIAVVGDRVASAGGDAAIRVWSRGGGGGATLTPCATLRDHRGSIMAVAAFGPLLLSGGRDNLVRVWDVDAAVCRAALRGHTDDVLALAALAPPTPRTPPPPRPSTADCLGSPLPSMDGDAAAASSTDCAGLFASASADGTVRVWAGGAAWACVRVLTGDGGPTASPSFVSVECVAGEAVVAGGADGQLRAWDVASLVAEVGGSRPASASAPTDARPAKRARRTDAAATNPSTRPSTAPLTLATGPSPAARLERELERALAAFVRLRTVSADPSLREECYRGAKWLAALLDGIGAEVKFVRSASADRNPVVLGRLGRSADKPTVTFYGHYDVQPAMEREWATDPFAVASVDGHLYGRGTSDNKGPILAFVYAVKELLARGGPLPVNVAFVFEGEEENGSGGFREAVEANLPWFDGTAAVVISNTLWVGEKVPCLTTGMRGMISATLEVSGPARDLHSGNDGGVIGEPLVDLAKLLATLTDARGRVSVSGLTDGVRPGLADDDALARVAASAEFSATAYAAALGGADLLPSSDGPRTPADLLRRRWCEPALSVCDVRVGDDAAAAATADPHYRFGPTRSSVIPRSAAAAVSMRFVPDQDPDALVATLRAHIDTQFSALGSRNTVSLRVKSVGHWWEADPASPALMAAAAAVEGEWGVAPLFVREGGTMPVASLLERLLGARAVLIPFGQASDACHLANERIGRANLRRGKNVVRELLCALPAALRAEKK